MRNRSGEILRQVEGGESVIITNNGRPVAVLSSFDAEASPLELLRASGKTRPPQAPREALKGIERVKLDISTAELLRESRRDY